VGLATGQQTIFGVAEEITYATPVAPDRFYDILSETLALTQNTIQSNALRGGTRNARLSGRRQISTRTAAGQVKLEVVTNGFGRLLKHILGSTPTSAQQASTTAYLHTFNLGDQLGKSLTAQKQIRDGAGNAVGTFTYPGAKVIDAEFSISVGNLLDLTLNLDAQNEVTSVAAATASFLAGHPYSFKQGTLLMDGSAVANVKDCSIKVANALDVARFFLGSNGLKAEQADNGFVTVTGKLTAEFVDLSLYNRFQNDTATALVLDFEGNQISGIYNEMFKITVPEIHMSGESPKVGGPGTVTTSVAFEGLAPSATTSAVKFEYMSTDTTP
jgi:hypothetical protein